MLDIMLADNVKAREQDASGDYHYVTRLPDEEEIDSQAILRKLSYRVSEDEE